MMCNVSPRLTGQFSSWWSAVFLAVAVLCVTSETRAQPPQGGGFLRIFPAPEGSSLGLLRMGEVQTELKLDAEQQKKVDEVLVACENKVRDAMSQIDFPGLMELEPEIRDAQLAELRKQNESVVADADREVQAILNAEQNARIAELQLQRQGPAAWNRPEIAAKLELDDEQKEKLAALLPQLTFEPRSGRGPGGPGGGPPPGLGGGLPGGGPPGGPGFGPDGPPDFMQMEDDRRKATEDAMALLTPAQREGWRNLRGTEFKFPERMMGPGGPMGGPELKLVGKYDTDKSGWLNREERIAAREDAKKNASAMGGPGGRGRGPGAGRGGDGGGSRGGPDRGFGPPRDGGPGGGPGGPGGFGPPGMGRDRPEAKPGQQLSPADVDNVADAPLYDASVLRTLFFEFENEDWETELADFKNTDVDVPARLTVDGKVYENVGVSFRGASSYFMTPAGYKRSLNVSVDLADGKQRLLGYKTLNLLNSAGDTSMMHPVVYSHIANQYLPTPKANFVRVVINGEDWGIYPNVEQFNRDFVSEHFDSGQGIRWKVPGSPGGGGSLSYLGEDVARYKRLYEIKSADNEESWFKLINLCKVLNETPAEELESALEPILDIDGVLRFLAVDVALINSDGYWTRGSDFNLYCDEKGKFHIIPHDMNEAFQPAMGPGGGGGGGARGGSRGGNPLGLDPLVGLDDRSKPLRSKLLAVPALQEKYLTYVKQIAEESLDWNKLGPIVASHRALIADIVAADTRKLVSTEAFEQSVAAEPTADDRAAIRPEDNPDANSNRTRGRVFSLHDFAESRRQFLLDHERIKNGKE